MKMVITFFLLFIFSANFQVLAADQNQPADFNSRLKQAFHTAAQGHPEQAKILFEDLLKANPEEWLIYQIYADTLRFSGDADSAVKVYQRALSQEFAQNQARKQQILDSIQKTEQSRQFHHAMENALPWDKAKVVGSNQFAVTTNIPEAYYRPVVQEIAKLYQKEQSLLAEIFGPSSGVPTYMPLYIFGRWTEYVEFTQKNRSEKMSYSRLPVFYPAYYDEDQKALVIYFDGGLDWFKTAHEMTHFILRDLYLQRPSRWIDEGLAEYMAFKLEKENSKIYVLDTLEYSNWLYDQGQWEGVADFFAAWESYEHMGAVNPTLPASGKFYIMAWSLMHFFLEGEDPFFTSFFKEYLKHEKESGLETRESVRRYLQENLNKDQQQELDNKWVQHVLSLTYDKI